MSYLEPPSQRPVRPLQKGRNDWASLLQCGDTAKLIARCIAEAHGTTLERLQSPCRRRHTVLVRNAAIRALDATDRYSYAEIGRFFNRDHTTVLYALGRTKRMPSDLRRAA